MLAGKSSSLCRTMKYVNKIGTVLTAIFQAQRCNCQNPTVPMPHSYEGDWQTTSSRNHKMAKQKRKNPFDVVIYGDSITEHLQGTDLGTGFRRWIEHRKVFQRAFEKESGGLVDGLALGIGGDTVRYLFRSSPRLSSQHCFQL